MPENDRLSGSLDQIDLSFVEREATPRLLMKLSIQLHLAGLSLSNTVSILELFGVERVRSTVHNWVHKAELQPEAGRSPDRVAVDETVIRLDDEQYWLYAAVDPETNECSIQSLCRRERTLSPTRSSANCARNMTSIVPCSSSMVRDHCKTPAVATASISDTNATEIATASNVFSER